MDSFGFLLRRFRRDDAFIDIRPFIRRNIFNLGVLAELQYPDVGGDAPAVVRRDSRRVTRHGAKSVSDDVEKMSHRRLYQLLGVIRSRLAKTAPYHHSIAIANSAVAGRAVNVESLLAPVQIRAGDRKREIVNVLAFYLARIARAIEAKISTRHGSFHRRPRGTSVAEKIGRGKWLVAGLVVHVLPATGKQHQARQKNSLVGQVINLFRVSASVH